MLKHVCISIHKQRQYNERENCNLIKQYKRRTEKEEKIVRSVGGYRAILYGHKTKHQNMITNIVTVD